MKLKNKRFRKRQAKRIAKRENHQKKIAKLIHKFGGDRTMKWFLFRLWVARKIEKHKKVTKKLKKLLEKHLKIAALSKKAEISGGK